MSLSLTDQGELLTALHARDGSRPFDVFLDRFRRRMGARCAMIVRQRGAEGVIARHVVAQRGMVVAPPDSALLLAMRPGRSYPLDELWPQVTGGGRAIRSASAGGNQWLVALDSPGGFNATDSALMTSLSPHVAIACQNLAQLDDARDALTATETGAVPAWVVAWSLRDRLGRAVAGDGGPAPRGQAALAERLANGAAMAIGDDVLALPPPIDHGGDAVALMLSRIPARPIDRAAAFAAEHGTSRSEAATGDRVGGRRYTQRSGGGDGHHRRNRASLFQAALRDHRCQGGRPIWCGWYSPGWRPWPSPVPGTLAAAPRSYGPVATKPVLRKSGLP